MAKIAFFDCLSGISGDMTLGALIDLGGQSGQIDASGIETAVKSMGLPELTLTSETVKKNGFRAIQVKIDHPPEHAHRHLHHITEMIDRADSISDPAKALAHKIFRALAEAEAKVHGSTIEKVHFHEVGAIDSIADIVGTAVAMTALGIETVASSAVPTGSGTITIAHGLVSVPAPATAELLRDIPIASSSVQAELTTPTGAAILKATGRHFGTMPSMTLTGVGYGAGTKDFSEQANVLRVLIGETAEPSDSAARSVESDSVLVLETNIDDSSAQQMADCARRLMAAGALDVFQTPCVMKKGRVGVVLTVITSPSRLALMEDILFTHSTSIGIRRHSADRHKLNRSSETVETRFGPVRGKRVLLPAGSERFAIEDDDAVALATENGTTVDQVRLAAAQAWAQRGT
ncbi:nickel pincer cofactor biosynthesis protein LarC [Novipirellula artificiosorum]|uniref:Putative nickel insertion protein n=1 Tax=Novipirellula artificiosorum TaxID=2528016 RepID=A0A5C6DT58_9BACT|nr:nickel pincer cofactor biosynthesis protein LarC [Novipirellula artificiosorum]TWU40503.1 hypothetical protein Poly41_13360 [Novipirellula artificiosorum]